MIEPKRAAVRPRALLPGGEGDLPLEDAVRARLEAGAWGAVELTGLSGAGKSTALAHLAAVFASDNRVAMADRPDAVETEGLLEAAENLLVVCASPARHGNRWQRIAERWRLARWGDDECIEYLLAGHRDQCAAVMHRLQADPQRRHLAGLPELVRIVLDQLAADAAAADVPAALRREITDRFPHEVVRCAAGLWCYTLLCHPDRAVRLANLLANWEDVDERGCALLRHSLVQHLLAAEYLAEELRLAVRPKILVQRLPEELLDATAALLRDDEGVILKLTQVLAGRKRARHAMAVSLLNAAGTNWRPADGRGPLLRGAYLRGVHWSETCLGRVDVTSADLRNADLTEVCWNHVDARLAQLSGARLHGARLRNLFANKANLAGADLSHVRAPHASLNDAVLDKASLEGALLRGASFLATDLRRCNLQRADLAEARLNRVRLADANFSGANLSSACLDGLDLRPATFTGARFTRASARFCNLECMRLPGADFELADLNGALLTGSQMPDACFRGASLSGAKLAEIEWERADLRDADLRSSTFHLGSSRSGLVDDNVLNCAHKLKGQSWSW